MTKSQERKPFKFAPVGEFLEHTTSRKLKNGSQSEAVSPSSPTRPSTREGKKGVTFYVDVEEGRQLKMLSAQSGQPLQDLMVEAVEMLFAKYGRQRVVRE